MTDPAAPPKFKRWLRRAGLPVGLLLLGLSLYFALATGQGTEEDSGWARIARADPLAIAGLAGVMCLNLLTASGMFWMLNKPFEDHRPISYGDMLALISGTSLLNYAMRAGLAGRVAYLKVHHGVSLRASLYIFALFLSGLMAVCILLFSFTSARGALDGVTIGVHALALMMVALIMQPMIRRLIPLSLQGPMQWTAPSRSAAGRTAAIWVWLMIRSIDILLQACQVWLAADLFGTPLTMSQALLLSTGALFIRMLTPLPNGLGAQEWFFALMGNSGLAGEHLQGLSQGLGLALLLRAVEAAVFITTGLIALGYLRKKMTAGPKPE